MRRVRSDNAGRLAARALSAGVLRERLRSTAGAGRDPVAQELSSQVDLRLARAQRGLRDVSGLVREGLVEPKAVGALLADSAASEAFGGEAVGGAGPDATALMRWSDLLDRVLGSLAAVLPEGGNEAPFALEGLAQEYLRDAELEARSCVFWSGALLLLVVSACAVAVAGLFRVGGHGGGFGLLGAHLGVSGALLIGAVPSWWQGERHRRASADARRTARQVSQLSPFLAPLPRHAQTVMRAALAQRLFARSIGDDDPLREPLWPAPADLFLNAGPPSSRAISGPGARLLAGLRRLRSAAGLRQSGPG